jgi:5'(3')-deoxyribonucleotidase
MKPTVLIDADGVIANFHATALDLIFEVTGRRYPLEKITTWDTFHSLDEPQEVKDKVWALFKEPGNCARIEPFPEAKDGIRRLAQFADIICVTSPFKGSATWAHEREMWLEKHFGEYIQQVIHARDKRRVHGDIFVDDKIDHVRDWRHYWHDLQGARVTPVLWGTRERFGRELVPNGVYPATTWNDVLALVRPGY